VRSERKFTNCVHRIYTLSYTLVPPQSVGQWQWAQEIGGGGQGQQFSVFVTVQWAQ